MAYTFLSDLAVGKKWVIIVLICDVHTSLVRTSIQTSVTWEHALLCVTSQTSLSFRDEKMFTISQTSKVNYSSLMTQQIIHIYLQWGQCLYSFCRTGKGIYLLSLMGVRTLTPNEMKFTCLSWNDTTFFLLHGKTWPSPYHQRDSVHPTDVQ